MQERKLPKLTTALTVTTQLCNTPLQRLQLQGRQESMSSTHCPCIPYIQPAECKFLSPRKKSQCLIKFFPSLLVPLLFICLVGVLLYYIFSFKRFYLLLPSYIHPIFCTDPHFCNLLFFYLTAFSFIAYCVSATLYVQ